MRVPDEVLKCVCFLGVKRQRGGIEEMAYGGTGFFISVPSSIPGSVFKYLVTAKHNLFEADGTPRELYVRINTIEGGADPIKLVEPWELGAGASDVAITPWPAHPRYQRKMVETASFATPEVIKEFGIGCGDELFMTGLFTARPGAVRNEPIVRSGIIAAMPSEPLLDDDGKPYHAYIAEVRSIGGLSGSPVFVLLYPGRVGPDSKVVMNRYRFYLLGMVRGHWDMKREQWSQYTATELRDVNMGMAIITPADDIAEVLRSEEIMKHRAYVERYQQQQQQHAIVQDSSLGEPEESEFTKAEFLDALKRVSRKLPGEGKSET